MSDIFSRMAESLPMGILRDILARAVVMPSDIAQIRVSVPTFPRTGRLGASLLEYATDRLRDVAVRTVQWGETQDVALWPVVDQFGPRPYRSGDRPHDVYFRTQLRDAMRVTMDIQVGTDEDDGEDLVRLNSAYEGYDSSGVRMPKHPQVIGSDFTYDPARGKWRVSTRFRGDDYSYANISDDVKVVAICMLLKCAGMGNEPGDIVATRRRDMCIAAAMSLERGVSAASTENLAYNPWSGSV